MLVLLIALRADVLVRDSSRCLLSTLNLVWFSVVEGKMGAWDDFAELGGEYHRLEFTGNYGALVWLAIKTLLLSVFTLGIYWFWGRTKIRQYLWKSMSLDGDPFEYTGTGLELFLGFLKVMALYLLFVLLYFSPVGLILLLLSPLLWIGVVVLFGAAYYLMIRYRLQRTRWRGIRGDLKGNPFHFGLYTLLAFFVSVITFGLAWPYFINKTFSLIVKDTRFGDQPFGYHGNWGTLFLWCFLGAIALYLVPLMVLLLSVPFTDLKTIEDVPLTVFIPPALLSLAVMALIANIVSARIKLHFFTNISLGEARLVFNGTIMGMVWLAITNALIVFFTVGIAIPAAHARWLSYYCENFRIEGKLPLEHIGQAHGALDQGGEGLAAAFDIGAI